MPRKKKTTQPEIPNVMDWAIGKSNFGTPTMVLLPARNYHFKVLKQEHKITLPRTGKYMDIAPEVFKEEDGDFMLYDEESKVMYLPAITKVLFAVSKYPELENNQLFAPIALIFNDNEVDIIGQVVEMLPPPTQVK
jgi:hypothetical protein